MRITSLKTLWQFPSRCKRLMIKADQSWTHKGVAVMSKFSTHVVFIKKIKNKRTDTKIRFTFSIKNNLFSEQHINNYCNTIQIMFIVNKYHTSSPTHKEKETFFSFFFFFKLSLQLECNYVRIKSEIPQLIPEQLITFCANWWSELISDSVVEEPTLQISTNEGTVNSQMRLFVLCKKHVRVWGLRISKVLHLYISCRNGRVLCACLFLGVARLACNLLFPQKLSLGKH